MKIYEFFARRNFPRTYTGKILFVSFLGVHVPMFGAVGYALLADPTPFVEQLDVLGAMLAATLVGTAATLFVMQALLAPVRLAADAASGYLEERHIPRLPTRYTDGAGVLMASVQESITRLDASLETTRAKYEALENDSAETFRILSGLRHDFRTPLTHILGFADLMKAEAIGPLGNKTYQDFAHKIGRSGQELLKTLNSVLDLSDSQTAAQRAEESDEVELVEMAEDAVALEHLHAETRGVGVTLQSPGHVLLTTVPGVAKSLLETLLYTSVAATRESGHVVMSVEAQAGGAEIALEAHGATLTLEDVPPTLGAQVTGLASGTGATGLVAETSTPLTLRLALADTLCRTVGARLEISQEGDVMRLKVELRATAGEVIRLAA